MLAVKDMVAGYQAGSRVLDGLSLDIASGEVVALIGRNGMGKTTFLKALTGHVRVSSGSVRLNGDDITNALPHMVARAGIGYVPQGREILAELTVEQNLLLGALGKPGIANEIPGWVFEMFPILQERRRQRGGTLSGGQQQQLAIARALIGKPDLLLLDEPSEGIQPSIVEEIGVKLGQIAGEQELAILLVEQNLELVTGLAERCLFIENGRIVEETAEVAGLHGESQIVQKYLSV